MFFKQNKIYFMHINKTGGTYVEDVLSKSKNKNKIKILGHHSNVLDIPRESFFFITVRDPFDRMCSSAYQLYRGVNSSKYKALKNFENADDFIKCLCNPKSLKHLLAVDLHNTYPHLSQSYWSFFISKEYFYAVASRLLIALETSNLSNDINKLFNYLKIEVNTNKAFDKTIKLNRSSNIENYREKFGEDIYDNYKILNPLEFEFYDLIKKFIYFDDRYKFTLKRYLNEL